MKFSRIILKGILALTTFFTGVAATPYFFELFPPKVTLCQLARNSEFYRDRMVTLEADARAYGAVFVEDASCGLPDAEAGIWRAEGYEPALDVQKLYAEPDTEIYKARILVTGRFDPYATPGCFAPKAAIRASRIELRSEITSELLKRHDPLEP